MEESKKHYCLALVISFAVFGIIFMPIIGAQEIPSASVKITHPGNGAIVDDYRVTVRGSSSGLGDPDLHLYILVHPVATSLWWVQPFPTVDRDGNWVTRVYLGESDVGNNEDYAIKAIITTEKLYEGNTFKVDELPSSIAEDQIIVTRRDKTLESMIFSSTGLAAIGIIIAIIFGLLGIRQWRRKK